MHIKKIICYMYSILFLLLLSSISTSVLLTEIMIEPIDGAEWVEFFTGEDNINLTYAQIADNYSKDNIGCCISGCELNAPAMTYFIITENRTSDIFFGNSTNQIFCVDDSKIGNGLGNSADALFLYIGDELLVNFSYVSGTREGKTLSYHNGTYIEADPTPLYATAVSAKDEPDPEQGQIMNGPDIEIGFVINSSIYAWTDYGSVFILKNKDYPRINKDIEAKVLYNISYFDGEGYSLQYGDTQETIFKRQKSTGVGRLNLSKPGEYLVCGQLIYDEDPEIGNNAICMSLTAVDPNNIPCGVKHTNSITKRIYDSGEQIAIALYLSNEDFPFEITYWAEDMFGNIVKEKTVTKNLNNKHMTFNTDTEVSAILLRSNLTHISCNNSNSDIFAESIAVIRGTKKPDASSILISDYDKEASFGDIIMAKLIIYRGNTSKYSVRAYLQSSSRRASEVTTVYIKEKYSSVEVEVPVVIDGGCEGNYESGDYELIFEGLETEAKSIVKLTGNALVCPKGEVQGTSSDQKIQTSGPIYELLAYHQSDNVLMSAVKLSNREEESHTYSMTSSLMDGRKKLSSSEEKVVIEAKTDLYRIIVSEIPENTPEAALRISVLRDDRKTPYTISKNITLMPFAAGATQQDNPEIGTHEEATVSGTKDSIASEMLHDENDTGDGEGNLVTGEAVYESKNISTSKAIPYMIIALVVIVTIALIKMKHQ